MADEQVLGSIARAQETANQAHDMAKNSVTEVNSLKERVNDMSKAVAFVQEMFTSQHNTMKVLENSVVDIKISNATMSNEVKNMGLSSNRIEGSVNTFIASVGEMFKTSNQNLDELSGEVDDLRTEQSQAKGSLKTWGIVGGAAFVIFQLLLAAFLTYHFGK